MNLPYNIVSFKMSLFKVVKLVCLLTIFVSLSTSSKVFKEIDDASIHNFILNGTTAPSPVPFHVFIHRYNSANNRLQFGGGTLISTSHVLTAGHLFIKWVSKVTLRTYRTKNYLYSAERWECGFGSQNYNQLSWVSSVNFLQHNGFHGPTRANDIGIITLPNPIIISGVW